MLPNLGGMLAELGVDLPPIVAALPAELPVLEVRSEQPDRLFALADGSILHLEFQMTSQEGDLPRFYRYQFAAGEHYGAEVHTVVFYGPGIASAPSVLRRGSAIYTVRNAFVGQLDGEAALAALRERLDRGEALTGADRARLMLVPLMAHRRPLPEAIRAAGGGEPPARGRSGDGSGDDARVGVQLHRAGDGKSALEGAGHGERIAATAGRGIDARQGGGQGGGRGAGNRGQAR